MIQYIIRKTLKLVRLIYLYLKSFFFIQKHHKKNITAVAPQNSCLQTSPLRAKHTLKHAAGHSANSKSQQSNKPELASWCLEGCARESAASPSPRSQRGEQPDHPSWGSKQQQGQKTKQKNYRNHFWSRLQCVTRSYKCTACQQKLKMWAASALPVLRRWPSATAAAPPTGSGPRCERSPWASPGTCSGDAAWSCAGYADRGRCSPAGSGCTAGLFPPGGCGRPVWHATLCWQHTPLLRER